MKVPEGWQMKVLHEVCQPQTKTVHVNPEQTYRLMGVRWYGNGPHLHSETHGSNLNTKTLNQVKEGQLTYNKMWVSKGAFGVIQNSRDTMFATTEYPTFSVNSEFVNLDFLRHYMNQDTFREMAMTRCRGTTSRARLNPKDFLQLDLLLPPLPEQRRIAEILSSLDEAIAATQAVIEQTRVVKQSVLKRLLTKGIGHTRFKQTEIGEIPEAWDLMPLQAVADIQTGLAKGSKTPKDPAELPYLRVANVQDGYLDLAEMKSIQVDRARISRYSLCDGDVLLTEGGDFNKLGRGTVWHGQIKPCLHQNHVFAVRPNREVLLSEFLAALTASDYGKRYFRSCAKRTTNLASINSTQLKEFPTLVPSLEEQAAIVERMTALQLTENIETEERKRLQQTKSALLSDLLTGRKRVPIANQTAAE